MKAIFLDTSVLFKLYHSEPGSETYRRLLISHEGASLYLSRFSLVEFASICSRMVRMQHLKLEQSNDLLYQLALDQDKMILLPITDSIISSAQSLVVRYGSKGLRAPDGLQLATAVSLAETASLFLSADSALNDRFIDEGLPIG